MFQYTTGIILRPVQQYLEFIILQQAYRICDVSPLHIALHLNILNSQISTFKYHELIVNKIYRDNKPIRINTNKANVMNV